MDFFTTQRSGYPIKSVSVSGSGIPELPEIAQQAENDRKLELSREGERQSGRRLVGILGRVGRQGSWSLDATCRRRLGVGGTEGCDEPDIGQAREAPRRAGVVVL